MTTTFKRIRNWFKKGFSWQGDAGSIRGVSSILWSGATASSPDENSAVAACISSITDAITEPRLKVRRLGANGTYEDVKNTRILALLARPNRFCSWRLLLQATVYSYKMDGNAYWLKVRSIATNQVVELWYVPHWAMRPMCDLGKEGSEFITHYEMVTARGTRRVPVEDVVHFKLGIDPADPKMGLSPMKSLVKEYRADNSASDYAFSTLENMGVTGGVISPDVSVPDEVSPKFIESLREQIQQKTTGKNRGRFLGLSIPVKFQQFGLSPKDVEVSTLRRIPEERISAVLNVPAIVAGLGAGLERSTFSNMAEARKHFTQKCLKPLWAAVAEEINLQLLPEFDGSKSATNSETDEVWFDLSAVQDLQEDQDALHKRYRDDFISNLTTLGESRAALGLETDPALADLRAADLLLGPNIQAAAKMLKLARANQADRLNYETIQSGVAVDPDSE
jgi:HK97 family phage portal protein